MLASVNAQDKSLAGYGEAPAHGDRGGQRRLLLVTALVLLPWALHNGLLLPWEVRHFDASVREPALLLLRAALWLTPAVIYIGKNDPRSRATALGLGRPSWRGTVLGLLPALAYLGLVGALQAAMTAAHPASPSALLRPHSVYLLLLVALEELLLRGFLLGQLVRFTTSFRAQAIVAVLYALMHLPGWIALEGLTVSLVPQTISVLLLGVVLGVLTRSARSILPAIVVHFLNNVLAELLGAS
jgi:membrane protease YdiL (CAAX protease family)